MGEGDGRAGGLRGGEDFLGDGGWTTNGEGRGNGRDEGKVARGACLRREIFGRLLIDEF